MGRTPPKAGFLSQLLNVYFLSTSCVPVPALKTEQLRTEQAWLRAPLSLHPKGKHLSNSFHSPFLNYDCGMDIIWQVEESTWSGAFVKKGLWQGCLEEVTPGHYFGDGEWALVWAGMVEFCASLSSSLCVYVYTFQILKVFFEYTKNTNTKHEKDTPEERGQK